MLRRTALVVTFAMVVAGCGAFDPRPKGTVIIYGHNETPRTAWFGLMGSKDPPENVGFGPDDGVACLSGVPGAEVVSFDGPPNAGGRPERSVGRVPGGPDAAVIWVEVTADGSLATGVGVPEWWVGDPQAC